MTEISKNNVGSSSVLKLNLDDIESSYKRSHLGTIFYALVRSHAPKLAVELGVFQGYSSLHIAAAMRDNARSESQLHLIDLWETYPYRHCTLQTTKQNFEKNGLLSPPNIDILFVEEDAKESHVGYDQRSIDFLHIDISNTGDNLSELLDLWAPKMSTDANALIVLEGGSQERDQIPWMQEYSDAPIQDLLHSTGFNERFEHFSLHPFPSITLLRLRSDSSS